MKRVLLTIVFAVLTMSTAIFAQERPNVAVFPFEDLDNLLTRSEAIQFYRSFSNEFTNRSRDMFSIVPRENVERLIDMETEFQLSVFSAREKTAEWESVLNGTMILTGTIGRWGNEINIIVSIYNYPNLQQAVGGTTLHVENKNELVRRIPELVQQMQNEIAGTGSRPNTTGRTYQIGDTGPAGGIVFYDRGFYGDGWRYLEAAPAGSEWSGISWDSSYPQNIANLGFAIGMGKQNTLFIVEQLNRRGEANRAAQLCANLDVNGFKDWFLPSKDELDLIYKNLKQKGLGDFESIAYYWTSSQSNNNEAWVQNFATGGQETTHKSMAYRVRAIRAF